MTLTDLTPSTGQTEPNGEVGIEGIHGHRIEKVIRLRIQIRDHYDAEPTYPVLVHLATGGPHHGTLILDPDGARTECPDASFLWHERDAQGNLIALNEEFEYRMGTWSRYVGAEPDPNNPGQVRPVWGVAEDLGIRLETLDGAPLSYRVHPEPGKPDHFLCLDAMGQPCPDVLPYWAEYLTYIDVQTGRTTAGPFDLFDAYFLKDQFGNTVYGYTDTSATQPASNVVTEFKDQTQGDGGDFAGYRISTSWDANPSMPAAKVPQRYHKQRYQVSHLVHCVLASPLIAGREGQRATEAEDLRRRRHLSRVLQGGAGGAAVCGRGRGRGVRVHARRRQG